MWSVIEPLKSHVIPAKLVLRESGGAGIQFFPDMDPRSPAFAEDKLRGGDVWTFISVCFTWDELLPRKPELHSSSVSSNAGTTPNSALLFFSSSSEMGGRPASFSEEFKRDTSLVLIPFHSARACCAAF